MNNPGWVDLQVNGHNGVNFSDPELTESEFLRAADELFAAGTAVFLPTLITSPADPAGGRTARPRRSGSGHPS